MKVRHLHRWDISPAEAVTLQKELADQVIYDRPLKLADVHLVAGVDVGVKDNVSRAAVIVMAFPSLELVEQVTASQPTPFPYIPGLLSFREGPVLVEAFERLEHEPDVLIFDGMGRIHPRRIGIASHMGLWLDKPTIGCGKTHLIGKYGELQSEKGAHVMLYDHGEQLGVVLRTRQNVKPVYISPGHRIDLESAIAIVMACTTKYRLPEPIRQAHNTAGGSA
ncbi:MAG: deoxyribonuclease V [Chloroflexota bacterium]